MATPSSFTSIPIIDIGALRTGDYAAKRQCAGKLGAAARDVGFLYVAGHGLDDGLFDRLLDRTRAFFAQPVEKKMEVYIGKSRNHRGYVPEGEEVLAGATKDAKEAYDLSRDLPSSDPDYLAGNPLLGPNQWPDLEGFKEAVSQYYEAVFSVGRTLMQGFAIALGEAPNAFDAHLTKPPSQLRLIHYPYDASAEDRPGIGAHTDYECFTLLRSTLAGLEVLNGSGHWIDAPPVPGAFTVNIGDMLELWTNGLFVATTHRVRKVAAERYSFPLFFSLDYHTKVAPLPRFLKSGDEQRMPLIAGEHLFAQTAQVFTYQKKRLETGELKLPENALALSSFGNKERPAVVHAGQLLEN
jgi:isopenicillin N synthase-like dioxygenase